MDESLRRTTHSYLHMKRSYFLTCRPYYAVVHHETMYYASATSALQLSISSRKP